MKKKISSKPKAKARSLKEGLGKPFPIVGFGASAGGIEAFSQVLKYLEPDLGLAYVLIMHLSPKHKSALAEVLQPKTKMKVITGKNGLKVKPNNIYVIPPNTFMSLVDGHLKIAPRSLTTIGNFAVDYFLYALASLYKNKAIGVILSGTATDGTLGLKAIKANGGITFAQDDSAKFSGMPKSAYDSGYADFILSPEKIAKEISRLVKVPYTILPSDEIEKVQLAELKNQAEDIKAILKVVKNKFGVDFFLHYKQASIYRRIVRRMTLNKYTKLSDYPSLLEKNPEEVDALYNDFLINVTNFFRDPEFFLSLNKEIFPSIVKQRQSSEPVRIWIAGCATGEEAYSVAISFLEYCADKNVALPITIFASDLDANAIEKARIGIYPLMAMQGVPEAYLKKYFRKIDGHYQIDKSVREVCIFSQQNLLKDPPFSRMDLISCQNVLIYLETAPQKKILEMFHFALKPSGYLFLGKSETVSTFSELFTPLDKKVRIYSRKAGSTPPLDFTLLTSRSEPLKIKPSEERSQDKFDRDIDKLLISKFVAPSVLLNQHLSIVQFYGVTSSYINPVVGKASFNVLKMIREDLLVELRGLLLQARKTGKPGKREAIRILNKKIPVEISIEVIPKETANEVFYLVVFQEKSFINQSDKPKRSKGTTQEKDKTIIKLEDDLMQSRELIRSTNEEYETTYEELQANNEEILSSNEELKSVNEELETSKEELQSTNEELTTINDELSKRNTELKQSHTYAEAVIQTMHSPLLVLTSNLQVRMANKAFYQTFKLAPEQTESRFIYELGDNSWDIPILRAELNDLLSKKVNFKEFELIHHFPSLGELVLDVHAYRLPRDESFNDSLILLALNSIGELQKSNKQLMKANAQLEEFAYISSHDLQEPLRKIMTFSNYLLDKDSDLSSNARKFADKIQVSAERMSGLLKDLLNYSFFLKSNERVKIKVDLNEIVKNVLRDFELIIEQKKADVNTSVLPTLMAEPLQINQLFHNLISNALKFGKESCKIEIYSRALTKDDLIKYPKLRKDLQYVAIVVKDNGIGFHQQYENKMFELFQRLNDRKGAEGNGIGLTICKKIVDDHEGIITAEGRENEGATFTVILPERTNQH